MFFFYIFFLFIFILFFFYLLCFFFFFFYFFQHVFDQENVHDLGQCDASHPLVFVKPRHCLALDLQAGCVQRPWGFLCWNTAGAWQIRPTGLFRFVRMASISRVLSRSYGQESPQWNRGRPGKKMAFNNPSALDR